VARIDEPERLAAQVNPQAVAVLSQKAANAAVIAARLRGFTPWPGAWTTLEGKTVKLLEVEPLAAGAPPAGAPGSGVKLPGAGLAVSCGGGTALLVRRLQPEGKGAQDSLAFLNGLRRDTVAFGT